MARFGLTILAAAGIVVLTLMHQYAVALCVGIVPGAILFLEGAAAQGVLGRAHDLGKSRADHGMRLGACLALAGIAASAQGREPPLGGPLPVLLGIGQGIGLAFAVALAWHMQRVTSQDTMTMTDGAERL